MTPQQFKDARRKLGFSCAGLAREWSMGANGDRTIRRWEHGDVPVNPIAAYCIGLMMREAASERTRSFSGKTARERFLRARPQR